MGDTPHSPPPERVEEDQPQDKSQLIPWLNEFDEPKANPVPEKKKDELPDFVEVKLVSNSVKGDTLYADIINHSRDPYLKSNKMTNAHETTHDINSFLRNNHPDAVKVNGFYVREGRGIILYEPKLKKNDMIPYVPKSLVSFRYNLYIAGQKEWNDRPLYIMDEAISYLNGSMVAVQEVQKGTWDGKGTSGVDGCLDFSIYSVAMAMAIADKDPEYWKTNTQYRKFLIWYLKDCERTYKVGIEMEEFNWFKEQHTLLKNLRESPDAAKMREFIKDNLDGVWLK